MSRESRHPLVRGVHHSVISAGHTIRSVACHAAVVTAMCCLSALALGATTAFSPVPGHAVPVVGLILVSIALAVAVALLAMTTRCRGKKQHALEEREQRLKSILEATRDAAFFTTDVRGSDSKILDFSPGSSPLFGYTRDEIIGHPASDLFAMRDASRLDKLHDTIAKSGKPMSTEPHLVKKNGRSFPAIMTTYPVIDDTGNTLAALSFVVDMTEHIRTEQQERRFLTQIQHAEKLNSLEILAGGVAHDFNNLLVGVLGNAELALMDISPMSPARASVESIKAAAVRASVLTRQLLAYSGNARFLVDLVDVNRIIDSVGQLLSASVAAGVSLHFDLADDLPLIEADTSQVRQLLVSLVTNASDAIGDHSGSITVSTGQRAVTREYLAGTYMDEDLPEGNYVTIEVSDTGSGMSEDVLSRLFDPFFSTKTSGRGLGLASVLGIVRGHKGAIRVSSVEGEGSTFTVLLPACAEPAEANRLDDAPSPEPKPLLIPGTVLIIDDDDTVREVTTAMLSRRGCVVLAAANGPDGIEMLRENAEAVDIVMLNMTMPGMDGQQTFDRLHEVKPGVSVVLCTGYAEAAARERFDGMDLAGFVQKPFEMHQLIGLLSQIMTDCKGG